MHSKMTTRAFESCSVFLSCAHNKQERLINMCKNVTYKFAKIQLLERSSTARSIIAKVSAFGGKKGSANSIRSAAAERGSV